MLYFHLLLFWKLMLEYSAYFLPALFVPSLNHTYCIISHYQIGGWDIKYSHSHMWYLNHEHDKHARAKEAWWKQMRYYIQQLNIEISLSSMGQNTKKKPSLTQPEYIKIKLHHSNQFFFQQPVVPTTSTMVTPAPTITPEEDEKMRSILAKKEQELLMLQRKKVEMELEQMRRQVELAEKTVNKKVRFILLCLYSLCL